MTALAARVLELATEEIGVREDPPGSNRGAQVDRYLRSVGLDPATKPYPWCAAFICWCILTALEGLPQPRQFRTSAKCLRLVELNQALLLERPETGCIFIHLNPDGTGHCGFVVAVNDSEGILSTIEGNTDARGSRTGGQVMAQSRPLDYATAYLRVA